MIASVHTFPFPVDTLPSEIATAIYLPLNTLEDHKTPLRGPPGGRKTQSISFSLCDGCISLSIAEGLVSGVSAFFFLPVSGPYFIPVFLTFKVFFSLFTLPCSQTCEQTFVNKAQNIFKVNFYSKGNSSFSSTFMNPSGSFFGWIRFHER